MIRVNAQISIDEREIEESFVRASGPGGQNVNKLSTAVQLRFDVRRSPSLPEKVRTRLERLAGTRLTRDGVLVIIAQSHRTQGAQSPGCARSPRRFIRRAAVAPRARRPTRPTKASRERRIEAKKHQAGLKRLRGARPAFD